MSDEQSPTPTQDQKQEQSQVNYVAPQIVFALNQSNSTDPELETHIFGDIHSPGRQLGRAAAVIDLLVAVLDDAGLLAASPAQSEQAQKDLADWKAMRGDIQDAKEEYELANLMNTKLKALKKDNPTQYRAALNLLQATLKEIR